MLTPPTLHRLPYTDYPTPIAPITLIIIVVIGVDTDYPTSITLHRLPRLPSTHYTNYPNPVSHTHLPLPTTPPPYHSLDEASIHTPNNHPSRHSTRASKHPSTHPTTLHRDTHHAHLTIHRSTRQPSIEATNTRKYTTVDAPQKHRKRQRPSA